jgi:hypothetical protein
LSVKFFLSDPLRVGLLPRLLLPWFLEIHSAISILFIGSRICLHESKIRVLHSLTRETLRASVVSRLCLQSGDSSSQKRVGVQVYP